MAFTEVKMLLIEHISGTHQNFQAIIIRKRAVFPLYTWVVYRAVPENATEPSLVDDHVQDFPSSASFCLTVLGILETVAKGEIDGFVSGFDRL